MEDDDLRAGRMGSEPPETEGVASKTGLDLDYRERHEFVQGAAKAAEVIVSAGRAEGACEDKFAINPEDGIFAVFDGASGLKSLSNVGEGNTGGSLAAQLCAKVFTEQSDGTIRERLEEASRYINELFNENVPSSTDVADRFCTTAGIMRLNEGTIELACIADTPIIVIKEDGSWEMPIPNIDHDKESLQMLQELMKNENLTHAQAMSDPRMKEQLLAKRREQNETYGVLNGQEEAMNFIREATISAEGVATVLIISDGLVPPSKIGEEPNWQFVVDCYLRGGAEEIKRAVREIEEKDPNCEQYVRFKKHDDATILAVELSATQSQDIAI